VYKPEHAAAWKEVTDAVHAKGGVIFAQLWHQGRQSHSSFHDGKPPVSASDVKPESEDGVHTYEGKQPFETPHPLTIEEIKETVEDFRNAARIAKEAGFDGVELHSANGYLLDQFLQSRTNKRTDEYGGSVENRYRFVDEVVDAVLSVWPSKRVGVRLSPNGVFSDMGSPEFREQFLYTAEQLGKKNIGYLHVMDGLGFGFHKLGEPMTLKEFRAVLPADVVLVGNVGYTAESAAEVIGSGDADAIAFGRPFIANPDLVERFKHDWPLNPPADPSTWYGAVPDKPLSAAFTDYPTYNADEAKKEAQEETKEEASAAVEKN